MRVEGAVAGHGFGFRAPSSVCHGANPLCYGVNVNTPYPEGRQSRFLRV
jgi:hypothetical protein